jgi:hypothetical protein
MQKKKKDWFNRESVKKIIKDIDKSDVIKDECIESPVLGCISPQALSEGCKAVILLEILDSPHIYGTRCGDNCVLDILDIASRKDITLTLTLHYEMGFPDKFEAYLVESDKYIHSWKDYIYEYYKFTGEI